MPPAARRPRRHRDYSPPWQAWDIHGSRVTVVATPLPTAAEQKGARVTVRPALLGSGHGGKGKIDEKNLPLSGRTQETRRRW